MQNPCSSSKKQAEMDVDCNYRGPGDSSGAHRQDEGWRGSIKSTNMNVLSSRRRSNRCHHWQHHRQTSRDHINGVPDMLL